jgi:nucleoside-diphosphate kinase
MERTLVLIKPDAVQRGLVGTITERLERRGLRIVGMKVVKVDTDLAGRHYAVHQGKPFYDGLIRFITSSPVIAMVLEGTNAVEVTRATMGVTNPARAAPGTIRADFALEPGRNLTHGSDSAETARSEIAMWFTEKELVSYGRDTDRWIFE